MASLPVIPGHEGFIRKSLLLGQRPRGQSQPMPHAEPESAIERDQRIGLVRNVNFHHSTYATLYLRSLPETKVQRLTSRYPTAAEN